MTPRLRSISVRDFRSICGEVIVPLDAPVVLIHGQNGVGKTSILSALELGLTGQVPSLQGLGTGYASHLVHKKAKEGHVAVAVDGIADGTTKAELNITPDGFAGAGLLPVGSARFYSERCYLSQATLGRLLELYQVKDARKTDSSLTKFVKELLGLDRLDALIDGLHDSGDVRRFRTTVPAFWNVRESILDIEKRMHRNRVERSTLETERLSAHDRLRASLHQMGLNATTSLPTAELERQLAGEPEEVELQRLATFRREAIAIRQQWQAAQAGAVPSAREQVEARAKTASEALEKWRKDEGRHLQSILTAIAEVLPDTTSLSAAWTEQAPAAASQVVVSELERCMVLLARDVEDADRLAALDQDLRRGQARLVVLEEQLAAQAVSSGSLAQTLSGLLAHIHSDDCPVCNRDFGEVSKKPLQAHVSERIAALTEGAGRLQALSKERAEAVSTIAAAERDRGAIAGRQLAPAVRDQLKSRHARLEELKQALEGSSAVFIRGQHLMEEAVEASRVLERLRARNQQVVMLREATVGLARQAGVEPIGAAEALEVALDRIVAEVSVVETRLLNRQKLRRVARAELNQYASICEKVETLSREIAEQEGRLARLRQGKEAAEARITQSRELARRAREARTRVVRRVFNDSLNAVWRDLFVRLAPEEPFVPAFALPENQNGPVEAVLETHYRSGGKGGDPRAMLSAGNLNTAALTLFLALHLSVPPALPWLVIDDPVQSMDEVHIAQFTALLRTLSKQHGRQVIVAVHERPLFEYLALELSPAYPSDRLITIELGRSAAGETVYNFEPLIWRPDTAIAA